MTRLLLAIAVTVCALPGTLTDARAQSRAEDPRNRLPEAVNRIERETGGRVLSAERRTRGGREVSRIKVFTPEGRVRIMWDDPARDRPQPSERLERAPRADRSDMGERGDRGRAVPVPPRVPNAPQHDISAVVHGGAPEQTPLPERPNRRDDGSPGF